MIMKKIEYYVLELPEFEKNVRRLTKKKKFASLPSQVDELELGLEEGDFPGTLYRHSKDPEPHDIYKLRMANPDSNVGKSGGYRIYYIVVTQRKIVVMLTIYYKKEDEAVTDAYIDGLVDGVFLEYIPESESDTL